MSSISNRDYRDVAHSRNLSVNAKFILWLLKDHENTETGQCNPKIETLSRETGLHRMTVIRAVQELREIGLIETVKGSRANTYEVASTSRWSELVRYQKPTHTKAPEVSKTDLHEVSKTDLQGGLHPYMNGNYLNGGFAAVAASKTSRAREGVETVQKTAAAATGGEEIIPSELCRELLSVHPHPQQPQKAEQELQKVLRVSTVEVIRERHSAWREYWELNPGKFVPHLWRWFADGDWETAPPIRKPMARAAAVGSRAQALEDYFQRRRERLGIAP